MTRGIPEKMSASNVHSKCFHTQSCVLAADVLHFSAHANLQNFTLYKQISINEKEITLDRLF